MVTNNHTTLQSSLRDFAHKPISWVKENTAIIVFHGIGNQLPLETLDTFTRGIIKVYKNNLLIELEIEHKLDSSVSKTSGVYNNFIRLKEKDTHQNYLDIYEYYWANETEDSATWTELSNWLSGVVSGAKNFYDRNKTIGETYKDKSIFFDKNTGAFIVWKYKLFLAIVGRFLIAVDITLVLFLKVVGYLPIIGSFAIKVLKAASKTKLRKITNIIGDVVVYNINDPKSKFYKVRNTIINGGVEAIKNLLPKKYETKDPKAYEYQHVIVAGHSLGSQISYDCLNRINILISQKEIPYYNNLKSYITFGSPLDKIVFFLRENVPKEYFIKQQISNNYHSFKGRDQFAFISKEDKNFIKIVNPITKELENLKWRNYWDKVDYVSGSLDYFAKLTNVNCKFNSTDFLKFTHSDYWTSDAFYEDIINNYLQ